MTLADATGHVGELDERLVGELAIALPRRRSDLFGAPPQGRVAAALGVARELTRAALEAAEVSAGFEILELVDPLGESEHEGVDRVGVCGVVVVAAVDRTRGRHDACIGFPFPDLRTSGALA